MKEKKLIMPKGDGRLEIAIQSLKIYYEENEWMDNNKFVETFLRNNTNYDEKTDKSMIIHKARTARYFGFIKYLFVRTGEKEGKQGIITESGKRFYEAYKAKNKEAMIDTLIDSIRNNTFGRNNYSSRDGDSDVEPPKVLLKSILDLEGITKYEFVLLLFGMHNMDYSYDKMISKIIEFRKNGTVTEINDNEVQEYISKYGDWKFVQLLRESGVIIGESDNVKLSDYVKEKYKNIIENMDAKLEESKKDEYNDKLYYTNSKKGSNIILYGVPGCGKSYTIKKNYCDDFRFMERIVFHPDYMNTDFMGQIMPTIIDGKITYEFNPGAFTRILKKAIKDQSNHYYLIIEEINRGNAPAIFGEIFQLLDRDYTGESIYHISNEDIAKIVYGDDKKDEPVYIPRNLSIIATMNTADQNVFSLDTAFQRRWNMKMIPNDLESVYYRDEKILDTGVSWGKFNTVINELILEKNKGILSSEDKRLGAFFVSEDIIKGVKCQEVIIDKENEVIRETVDYFDIDKNTLFSEKVIKYLWDDAFKLTRFDVFEEKYDSLEKIIDAFNTSTKNEKWNIFNEEVRNKLLDF